MNSAENVAFWNKRAELGESAGTQDLILKQLEQRAILAARHSERVGQCVLEVGCGRGELAVMLSGLLEVSRVDAIDTSPEMIAAAKASSSSTVQFWVADISKAPADSYDLVVTERCLINLPNWDAQKQAIDAIANVLVPGGRFLMCEHSQDGLDYINSIRESWRRPAIQRPWHNQYFRDSDITTVTSLRLVECVPFSATYYFLSRILNDKLAEAEGKAPAYDAKINQLALRLPYDLVDARLAQGRLWIWQKPAPSAQP